MMCGFTLYYKVNDQNIGYCCSLGGFGASRCLVKLFSGRCDRAISAVVSALRTVYVIQY